MSEGSLGSLARQDFARGARAAVTAAAVLAAFEYVVSLLVAPGRIGFGTYFRFAALDITLIALFCLVWVPFVGAVFAGARLVLGVFSPDRARAYPGLFGGPRRDSAAIPWLWTIVLCATLFAAGSVALTLYFTKKFKEPFLIAGSLAALQLALIAALTPPALLLHRGFVALGQRLVRLGRWNPFFRGAPAFVALCAVYAVPVVVLLHKAPQLRDVMPWRLLFAAAILDYGVSFGARRVVDAPPVVRLELRRIAALGLALLVPLTLVFWGADPRAKVLAVSASPALSALVDAVRWANDFDRDGYGSLLGENDCAPFNPRIHPNAPDIPDNGIDENCNGRDFSIKAPPSYRQGERMPVPEEFRRDWNILLLTVDAVRYDHTGFGGYKQRKGRDTTPNLDKLAQKSVVFDFAMSPSAGTMASVPAIIASKFFHSGIALGPERRPMPPKILPENLMLAEVMKKAGYRTGAILTHEYFNDWGMEQGFDTYDNSLGAKPNPFSITSQDVTDKVEAWIAQQGDRKWFLWAHYLDPHGRYVAHPGETQYGPSEEDLYDGEIAYADKHLGRLFDFLQRMPVGATTIIVITSDHGDGFMEHGFINHGQALYRELVHVPLIVYVPELLPRRVKGAVSGLDAFPTIADLAGAPVPEGSVEGESLVPQLFYGRDDHERVVFAETNIPEPTRAAITERYKLIYSLKSNVYQLFQLQSDPWEKKNVWGQDKNGDKLKAVLDEWLDRVYFARDPLSQAHRVRTESFLLGKRPTPATAAEGTAAGAVRILGYDAKVPAAAGKAVDVTVYFESAKATNVNLRFEIELAVADAQPPTVRVQRYPGGDGLFPSSRWQPGDWVKETFSVKVPPAWTGRKATVALRAYDEKRAAQPVEGPRAADGAIVLGEMEVAP